MAIGVWFLLFGLALVALMVRSSMRISTDPHLAATAIGKKLVRDKAPKSYILALIIMVAAYVFAIGGIVPTTRVFRGVSLFGHLASFVFASYVCFLSLADLYLIAHTQWFGDKGPVP